MKTNNEINRLKAEYERREKIQHYQDLYSLNNPSYIFMLKMREYVLLQLFQKIGILDLSSHDILEVGCGSGGVLQEFSDYGASKRNLTGIDLLHQRLTSAKNKLPTSTFICADGQYLPFTKNHFDIVLQYTAFSSILDKNIRISIAEEMLRVAKSDGFIIWYDFWLNPKNKQTKGIQRREIRNLFPNCELIIKKITLAPPISRIIVPLSRHFAMILESLKCLNSHFLVLIRSKK